jgi:hypothetical protein
MSDQSNYNLIFDCSRFCYVSLCATQPGAIQGQILIRLDVGYNLFCKNKSVLKLRGDQLHGKITKSNFCFWIKSSNIYFLQVGKTVYQVRHKLYRDFKTDIHHIQIYNTDNINHILHMWVYQYFAYFPFDVYNQYVSYHVSAWNDSNYR